ncbi:hypothetical protein [Citrobacter koseri]|uniref:hypothetical protein n=1 Tax=Citrobacter koseri TaxID=545 RepID=UPI003891AAA5
MSDTNENNIDYILGRAILDELKKPSPKDDTIYDTNNKKTITKYTPYGEREVTVYTCEWPEGMGEILNENSEIPIDAFSDKNKSTSKRRRP